MATLYNAQPPGTNYALFTPISSVLNNLPAGAGTLAAIVAKENGAGNPDACGLLNSALNNWYHTISVTPSGMFDDDGLVGPADTAWSPAPAAHWYICVISWAAGTVKERCHHYDLTSPGGWLHSDTTANNGGNRAGPGTSGHFRIGYVLDGSGSGGLGLVAAWVGTALSDVQAAELSTNSKTSDWWNNSAGHPDLLVECTSTTLTDIGANPSTFEGNHGLLLQDPTNAGAVSWTFDGRGSVATGQSQQGRILTSRGVSW